MPDQKNKSETICVNLRPIKMKSIITTPYTNAAFYIICVLVAFTPLARGSVHPWSTTLIQISILIALILLIIDSLKSGTPVFRKTPLTRPLIALIILAAASTLLSDHQSLAWEGLLLLLTYIAAYFITQALTLSRCGWISTIGAIAFMIMVLLSQRRFQSKRLILILAGSTLVISAFILASTPIVERVMTFAEKDESASMESRIKAWTGTMDLISDHPYMGTGPGTYAAAFTKYQPPGLGYMFIQAHNDYLHFTADMGLFIVPVMLWIVFVFFRMGFKKVFDPSRQTRGFALAAMAAVTAILIHSISDFNLLIPANALLFTVIAGTIRDPDKQKPLKLDAD